MKFTEKRALTIVELMIVVGLSFFVINVVANTFFTNIANIKSGEKINDAEFEKFMIWKDISTNNLKLQTKKEELDDGIKITEKAKIIFEESKGDGYGRVSFINHSFPDGYKEEVSFYILNNNFYRLRDGREYVHSNRLNNGIFRFEDGHLLLEGIIEFESEISDIPYEIPLNLNFKINKRTTDVKFN
ncbi:MAG: hypothetical protein ACQESP_04715 [Candidatus Muiribacteriota bacterium]